VTRAMSHLKGSSRIDEVSTARASESALDREMSPPVYLDGPARACINSARISAVTDHDKDDGFPLGGGRSGRSSVFDPRYGPRFDLVIVGIDHLSTERRSSTDDGKVREGDPLRVEI
jgi:hypothetical protein